MSTKHTPLPWAVEPIHEKSDAAYEVTRLCGYVITSRAPAWSYSSKHDADLIVKAVNAHDELITALRTAEIAFDLCAMSHRQKGTPEHDRKAKENERLAQICAAAIAKAINP